MSHFTWETTRSRAQATAPVPVRVVQIPSEPSGPFDNIQPGQIFVTHISGRVGTWIGFGEFLAGKHNKDYKFSHAGICLGGSRIIEAEPDGARFGDLSEYNDGRPLAFSPVSLMQDKGKLIAEKAQELQGTPYGFLDYGAIATNTLHVGFLLRNIAESDASMICSTLAVVAYKRAGIDLFPGILPGYIMPSTLASRIGAAA